jgi:ATP-binding cassette subfamily F protein 3
MDPDDRIALLGRNGNGKTTLARLLSGRLPAMAGHFTASSKLKVGYFAQHQVEELDVDETPLQCMSRQMPGAKPVAVRAQLGRFGFSGERAELKVGSLSGGERARLALALITREAPHLIILDEPTNHLDVDARESLVQALAEYTGAVVVVSHDRHLLELTSDRLLLVAAGTAKEYPGSLDDYRELVLGRGVESAADSAKEAARLTRKDERRRAATSRSQKQALRKAVEDAELEVKRLTGQRTEIDRALFEPSNVEGPNKGATFSVLMKKRADIERALAKAETRWLEASEALEEAEADAA